MTTQGEQIFVKSHVARDLMQSAGLFKTDKIGGMGICVKRPAIRGSNDKPSGQSLSGQPEEEDRDFR